MAPPQILISAGEASSDMYAARLATALQKRTGAHLFGMGGAQMREAGVELVADASDIAVVGITEVLRRLPAVWRAWRTLECEAERRKPVLAITVDSPGFNFGLARRLKKQGVRNVYFISPQIWAWRPGRMRWIQRRFERVLVIFPFEEEIYRKAGVAVDYVGHPLVDSVHAKMTREQFAAQFELDAKRQIVAVLPGSRPGEIERNMPIIAEACENVQKDHSAQFVIAAAPGLKREMFEKHLRIGKSWTLVEGKAYDTLAAADCAVVSSGTATVEAALLGTPMVVVYRVSRLTGLIARRLVTTPLFAMVNLISERKVVPELIQDKFVAPALEKELRTLLDYPEERERQRKALAQVQAKLGTGGTIDRAAEIIAGMISSNSRGQLSEAL
ncbi:MAG TPA: lipid-A-disaccharide synthase [Candidatus Acidoferrales bacterium]|nr:lipid-A-disaccharide synthase [Candidatus Acidoferrales bacterium]